MPDKEIRFALADLYEKIRDPRKEHHTAYKIVAAASVALRQFPEFGEAYAKEWAGQCAQLDRPASEALSEFDQIIRRLRNM